MQIKILRLDIAAFKGIKSLTLLLDGKDAEIRGRNGSGKTSIYDAFLWLLFGKDSTGATKFDIRPLNEDGSVKIGVDTEVECEMLSDGKTVKLKRALHEKYRTLPGSTDPIYAGVETLCWIDDVPVKLEKEYQPFVAGIVGDEETFRLLAIHGAFLRLPWEQRRKYLVDAAGGSAEQEILSRPEFSGVPDVLQGKTADEARKRLREQSKRIAEDIRAIPNRIDELRRALPDITEEKAHIAREKIASLDDEIAKINDQMAGGMEAFRQARALMDEERRLTAKLEARKIAFYKPFTIAKRECEEALENAKSRFMSQQREYERMTADAESIKTSIEHLQASRELKLAQYHNVNDLAYTPPDVNTVCVYCGQPLPESKVQEMLDTHREEWMQRKTAKLDEIAADGKTTADRIAHLQAELKGIQESLDRKFVFLTESQTRIKDLDAQLQELSKPVTADIHTDPEYIALENDLIALQERIQQQGSSDDRSNLIGLREEKTKEQARYRECMAQFEAGKGMQARIDELIERQKTLGADAAKVEGDLDLLSRFNTACCTAMEDEINGMFSLIRWKLFEYQKNGEVKDCCIATVFGVPFDTGLNHAAQINAGIETIRVLSRKFGASVPCFVDNAEAVNVLEYTGGQMIKLIVSTDDQITLTKED